MSEDIFVAMRDKDKNWSFQPTLWLSSAVEVYLYKDIYRHESDTSLHLIYNFFLGCVPGEIYFKSIFIIGKIISG